MNKLRHAVIGFLAGIAGVSIVASIAPAGGPDGRELDGTIWVANRGATRSAASTRPRATS